MPPSAALAEELITIADVHDGGIDAAQHRIDPVQALDLLLLRPALGDVTGDRDDQHAALGGERPAVQLGPSSAAVAPEVARLGPGSALGRRDDLLVFPAELLARLAEQLEGRLLQQLLTGVPEPTAGRIVDVQQAHGPRIAEEDRVDGDVHGGAEAIQLLLDALALGDVAQDGYEMRGTAGGCAHDRGRDERPQVRAVLAPQSHLSLVGRAVSLDELSATLHRGFEIGGVGEIADVEPRELSTRITGHQAEGSIDQLQLAFERTVDDTYRRLLESRAVLLGARRQHWPSLCRFRHVLQRIQPPPGSACVLLRDERLHDVTEAEPIARPALQAIFELRTLAGPGRLDRHAPQAPAVLRVRQLEPGSRRARHRRRLAADHCRQRVRPREELTSRARDDVSDPCGTRWPLLGPIGGPSAVPCQLPPALGRHAPDCRGRADIFHAQSAPVHPGETRGMRPAKRGGGAPGGLSAVDGHETGPDGVTGGTRDVVDFEHFHQLATIALGRLGADVEPCRDFLGRMAFRDQLQDFALAGHQSLERGLLTVDPFETRRHHVLRYRRAQESLAARPSADPQPEPRRIRSLDNVARRTGAQRLEHRILVRVHGYDHDARAREGARDPRSRNETVQARHHDVHEDHIGAMGGDQAQRLAAVGRLRDDFDSAQRLHQGKNTGAKELVIVREHDADSSRRAHAARSAESETRGALGSEIRIRVPRPAPESTSRLPPSISTRSRMPDRPRLPRLPACSKALATSKPTPSSRIVRPSLPSLWSSSIHTRCARAWRATLVRAS